MNVVNELMSWDSSKNMAVRKRIMELLHHLHSAEMPSCHSCVARSVMVLIKCVL